MYGHPKADYEKFYCKRRYNQGFYIGVTFGVCIGFIGGYLLKIIGG